MIKKVEMVDPASKKIMTLYFIDIKWLAYAAIAGVLVGSGLLIMNDYQSEKKTLISIYDMER